MAAWPWIAGVATSTNRDNRREGRHSPYPSEMPYKGNCSSPRTTQGSVRRPSVNLARRNERGKRRQAAT